MTTRRPRKRRSSPVLRKAQPPAHAARATVAISGTPPDLSRGVIVVWSGGGFDLMNPKEVRGGAGLTFMLLPKQKTPHLHQTQWREICATLNISEHAVGHDVGRAARRDTVRHCARCGDAAANTRNQVEDAYRDAVDQPEEDAQAVGRQSNKSDI